MSTSPRTFKSGSGDEAGLSGITAHRRVPSIIHTERRPSTELRNSRSQALSPLKSATPTAFHDASNAASAWKVAAPLTDEPERYHDATSPSVDRCHNRSARPS